MSWVVEMKEGGTFEGDKLKRIAQEMGDHYQEANRVETVKSITFFSDLTGKAKEFSGLVFWLQCEVEDWTKRYQEAYEEGKDYHQQCMGLIYDRF